MRRADPARRRRDARKNYILRKAVIVYALSGGRCAECGEDDIRVLQIDHISGYKPSDGPRSGDALYRWILRGTVPLEELRERLQVLCANCNSRKRWIAEELIHYDNNDLD